MKSADELRRHAAQLTAEAKKGDNPQISEPRAKVTAAVEVIGRSFSGSWLGYHSRIYYNQFEPPPPGAHFSQEWGQEELLGGMGSFGDWREFRVDDVKAAVFAIADNPDLSMARDAAANARSVFKEAKDDIESIISFEISSRPDQFLSSILDDVARADTLSKFDVANRWSPKGQIISRDVRAISEHTKVPPHIDVSSEMAAIKFAFDACEELSRYAVKAASYIERAAAMTAANERIGTNVFIGHGRSTAWRELKDFVQDRLALPWDEFNRVPVAGITNIGRLSEMLDAAAVAFIIMTAEDIRLDGETQARMNVIHEVGLFQGRLGFTKAIVLLEQGCAEFSNIQGLGQIRFPTGRISACFEEVRAVAEREGLINSR